MLTSWQDLTLKRCFGKDEKIIDCDWSYLKTLRTLKEPREAMPRLKDLLEFLTTPGLEDIWVLLDIKLDNNADDVMRLIAETLAEVKPTKPWKERVLLGCWVVRASTWNTFLKLETNPSCARQNISPCVRSTCLDTQ